LLNIRCEFNGEEYGELFAPKGGGRSTSSYHKRGKEDPIPPWIPSTGNPCATRPARGETMRAE